MAGMSKISAMFTADTSGLKAGASQASAAIGQMRRDFSSLSASVGTIKTLLAVDLFAGVARSAANVASSVRGMFDSSRAEIDALAKIADQSGRTYTQMLSLKLAAEQAGVGIEVLSKAAVVAEKKFQEAAGGSKSAIAAFEGIGLSLDKVANLSSAQRFTAIADAIGGLPDPAVRTARSMVLLGEEAAKLAPLFADGSLAMRQAEEAVERLGLGLSEFETSQVESMNDAFLRASVVVQGVIDKVTAGLAPAINVVLQKWEAWIASIGGVNNVGNALVDSIYAGLRAMTPWFDSLIANFRQMFEQSRQTIGEMLRSVLSVLAEVQRVGSAFGLIENAGTAAFAKATLFLYELDKKAAENALAMAQARGAGQEEIQRIQQRIGEANADIAMARVQLEGVGADALENFNRLLGEQKNAFQGAGEAFASPLTDALDQAKKMIDDARAEVVDAGKGAEGQAVDALGRLFANAGESAVRWVGEAVVDAQRGAKNWLDGMASTARELKAAPNVAIDATSNEAIRWLANQQAGGSQADKVARKQLEVQQGILGAIREQVIEALAIGQ